MSLRVSVIVPVYNPGRSINRCIRSILGQSLPPDAYEAIFVDDGSTDETPARLDALAAEDPRVRVIHQENSGWPGKPRNVGVAAARGDYVFFLDQDDTLGPEALERMVAMADRNGSDIVIGKMVGHGRSVPTRLFIKTRDRATLADTPLIDSLTPHKLFRRAFLEEHGVRFPEGRRRLEDHVFVVKAYFLARVISVLSDYPCYYHYRRQDGSNAGLQRVDPVGYYGNLREVLGIVEAHTEPGPFRDSLLQRFARTELLGRLTGRTFVSLPEDYRDVLFTQICSVIEDHIPESVDARLAPNYRTQMALVRARRLDLLLELARAGVAVKARTDLQRLERVRRGGLRLRFDAGLAVSDSALAFERSGDDVLLPVPDGANGIVPPEARVLPRPLRGVSKVVLRRRKDSTELALPVSVEERVVANADGKAAVTFAVESAIEPSIFTAAAPVPLGKWDFVVRLELGGHAAEAGLRRPVEAGDVRQVSLFDAGPLAVLAYWSRPAHRLTLDVRPASDLRGRRGLRGRVRRVARRLYRRVRRRP